MIVLGNQKLVNEKLAVILNSSQSKTPCGNDSWIKKTALAVPQLISSGYSIISSTGLPTWELIVYLVGLSGGNQIIISPVYDETNGNDIFVKAIEEFKLNPQNTAMIFIKPADGSKSPKENWVKRDRAAISLAQTVVPITIRPGGRLHDMIAEEAISEKCLCDFRIEYKKSIVGPDHYEFKAINDLPEWDYLTHWTKTCHGPWPGEDRFSFYRRLLASNDGYPNKAFNTLRNIIDEGKLRGSSQKIREGREVVGFTEADPLTVLTRMMRWRPRHVNWNFEPYGVAIEKELAISLGIRPVIYGEEPDFKKLSDCDKPFFQSLGNSDVDWRSEREWRCIGDLDLTIIPSDKIIFLAFRKQEALSLASINSGRVLALEK
jgi:hypothetical protein